MTTNNTDNDYVQALDAEERYDIFLSVVADERDVWILINDEKEFLKIHSEDDDIEFLPVWPSEEFAAFYAERTDQKLTPKSIALPEFFAKWVPGLTQDRLKIGVFPNSGPDVWVMEPSEVKSDLQDAFNI